MPGLSYEAVGSPTQLKYAAPQLTYQWEEVIAEGVRTNGGEFIQTEIWGDTMGALQAAVDAERSGRKGAVAAVVVEPVRVRYHKSDLEEYKDTVKFAKQRFLSATQAYPAHLSGLALLATYQLARNDFAERQPDCEPQLNVVDEDAYKIIRDFIFSKRRIRSAIRRAAA